MKNLLIILSAALISTTAFAEKVEVPAVPEENTSTPLDLNLKWKSLDLDADGFISREEAKPDLDVVNNWNEIDASQDNLIDPQEFVRFFTKS